MTTTNSKVDTINKNYIIRVEGKHAFHRGDLFTNFEQVADRLQAHTRESLVYYWIRDSRLVKFAHTKVSRKIDESLQYYSIKFSCIFGGQRFKSKANGLRPRKRQTRQIDCPAFISLRATKCGRKLEVIDVCNDHTHEISEQAAQELPQKRRPSQSLLEEVQELLHLDVDKELIIAYVKQKENKNILKKDLFNMSTHLRIGMPRTRHLDEQKVILERISLTAVDSVVQQAVKRRLAEFHCASPINQKKASPRTTIGTFADRSASAIGFSSLTPEIELLEPTQCVSGNDEDDFDKMLCNRIIIDYDEKGIEAKSPNSAGSRSPSNKNKWSDPTVTYKDFIYGNETSCPYDEFQLEKRIDQRTAVQSPIPASPVSNHSRDVDEQEYFNDLILISPSEAIGYAGDISLDSTERLCRDQRAAEEYEAGVDNTNRVKVPNEIEDCSKKDLGKSLKSINAKDLPKCLARKTRRKILNCSKCGSTGKLIKMQISFLRQQRQKLFAETELLKLKKKKLRAEINATKSSKFLS